MKKTGNEGNVYKTLISGDNRKHVDFHMPGHKGGRGIKNSIGKNLFRIDTTELPYTDNLYKPEGILKELLSDISKTFGSFCSRLLVNGASQGVLSSFHSCLGERDKVIIFGNCHISVLNALKICRAEPVMVSKTENAEKVIEDNRNAKAVFFTYPDYYGFCPDAGGIIRAANKRGMTAIADEAHGTHFTFSDKLPVSAVKLGADIVIHSMHKTLPVVTQAGLLHLNDPVLKDRIDGSLRIFGTTSPSYIFMVSAEYGFEYMKKHGKMELERIIREAMDLGTYEKIFKVPNHDPTRIVFNVAGTGRNGFEISKELSREHRIYIEMADMDSIVMISTVMNTTGDFRKLKKALRLIDSRPVRDKVSGSMMYDYSFEGRIAEKTICLFPPGTPLVMKGEVYTKAKLEYMQKIKIAGGDIIEC